MKKVIKFFISTVSVCVAVGVVKGMLEHLRGRHGWTGDHRTYGVYERLVKRSLDISLALMALLFLSPVMLLVAMLVRIKLGSSVVFKQERPGLDGNIFTLYKFRTMTDERGASGELLPDEERLTKFGNWLRSTSLDELPELINILKGDMSIVGPRPLMVAYLPRYNERQRHRHDVRPGLTGLAQVRGRNDISWEEKFELDLKYVGRVTFTGDVKIIFDTVNAVMKRDGINSENSVTMEEFQGSEE